MPTRIRYVSDGTGVYRVAGYHFEPGDGQAVPNDVAAHLTETAPFEAVAETCQTVKDDGEVCGRTLPCRYHSNS
jgi:hypothetical protein